MIEFPLKLLMSEVMLQRNTLWVGGYGAWTTTRASWGFFLLFFLFWLPGHKHTGQSNVIIGLQVNKACLTVFDREWYQS